MRSWPENAFLETPAERGRLATARYVILPVGYEGTTCYGQGTRHGPDAIIEASTQIEDFDEQLHDLLWRAGIHTHPHVLGEQAWAPEKAQERIFAAAAPLAAAGKTIIALGGEHSITTALVRAARTRWPDLTVLHFDAHADLRESYQSQRHSHACVMRRLHEAGVPFVSVGVRSYCRQEYEFMQAHGLAPLAPEEVAADLPGAVERILARLGPRVYITFDIDALDPAVAPGTGTPEPGGLSYRQALAILEAPCRGRQVVAADIVEVMPIAGNLVTEVTAARLAAKIIGYTQAARPGPGAGS